MTEKESKVIGAAASRHTAVQTATRADGKRIVAVNCVNTVFLATLYRLPIPYREHKFAFGSAMEEREPCPDRIIDDVGGAVIMGM